MKLSAAIITVFRLNRSIQTPAMGPSKAWGRKPAMLTSASTIGEPVSMVSHQRRAN
ncbi:hypothetical protein D3C78_1931420 [compost metagenome]